MAAVEAAARAKTEAALKAEAEARRREAYERDHKEDLERERAEAAMREAQERDAEMQAQVTKRKGGREEGIWTIALKCLRLAVGCACMPFCG